MAGRCLLPFSWSSKKVAIQIFIDSGYIISKRDEQSSSNPRLKRRCTRRFWRVWILFLTGKFEIFKIIVMRMIYSIPIVYSGFACLARFTHFWWSQVVPKIRDFFLSQRYQFDTLMAQNPLDTIYSPATIRAVRYPSFTKNLPTLEVLSQFTHYP